MRDEDRIRLRSVPDPIALLEGMFAHSPVAYQIYKRDGHCLLVNEAFRELFGVAPPPEYNVLLDERAEATGQLSILRRAFRGETVETTPTWYDPRELKQVHVTEGRRCAMICTAFPLFDSTGELAFVVFVFKDVTAEMEAREQAEAERDLLRAIIEQSGDGIIVADASGELTIFNRAAAEQHGASGRGLQAARWAELVGLISLDEQPLPFAQHPLQRALSERLVTSGRWRVCRPDGITRAITGTAAPLTRPDGTPGGAILVTRDETERLELEERVGTIGAQLRAIVEYSPAAMYLKDLDGRHLWVSPGYERRTGRPVGWFAGKTSHDVFPHEQAALMEESDRRVIASRAPVTHEETVSEGDTLRTYLTAKFPVLGRDGNLIAVGGMSTDVTEAREAERRLRQSEERFARYFQASPFPATISAADGKIVDMNPACERFAGVSRAQLVGRTGVEMNLWLLPEDRKRVSETMRRDGRVRDHEAIVNTPGGRRRNVLISIERLEIDGETCILSMIHDVTDHTRLKDELRQSQKMEAVGRLAGGVAHDFNNLLTALSGYNSLLLEDLPANDPRRGYAERIGQAAQRASALTHQLLAFSRKQPVVLENLDVNEVIRSTVDMLRRLIGEDVQLICDLSPRLDPVRADRAQIEQVIVNLVVNARDAMPQGGRITLETANVRDADGGGWVTMRVRDTGIGIEPQARTRLFEPFYTTKEPGKGTGLGLATVYGIVTQIGGQVRVDSEPGQGALFEVLLPRSASAAAAAAAPGLPRTAEPPGEGTLLLIEDDDSVRDFVGFVLRQQGYQVLEAEDGPRALELAHAYDGEIDLLISDVVMPHMRGVDVADALRAARPGLRVLHISGYPTEGIVSGTEFLGKPFSREALLAKVRELLERDETRRI